MAKKKTMNNNGSVSEGKTAFLALPIKLLSKENPKRHGSASGKRFKLYTRCKTVGDYIKAGGFRKDLAWDYERWFIEY